MKASKTYRWWMLGLAIALGVHLAAGAKLYAEEERSAQAKAAEDSPYEMYALFSTVVEQARAHYVDEDACSYEKLIHAALRGMLQSLDPYSQFMDKEEFTSMKEDTAGKFGGLGITIGMKGGVLTVISPMEGTPAFRAGLLPDDKILEIDGEATDQLDLSEAVKRMRGDPGTEVTVKVFRPRTQLTKSFTIERAIINVPSVKDTRMLDGNIGYVRVVQFGEDTGKDLRVELEKLQEEGAKGLVLDLRGNPGGLLSAAVEVAQYFLNRGDLIVFTRGRGGDITQSFRARPTWKFPKVPMAVLINGASASASEIVAGALQDNKRAVLVGEKSFGKGSVQTVLPQEGGTATRMTTAKYYTPSERVIHDNGIEPDVVVPVSFETWRKVILARNKAEGSAGNEEAEGADEGWSAADGEKTWEEEDGDPEIPDSTWKTLHGEDADEEAEEDDDGTVTDPQLDRACDMLKGVMVFQERR